MKTPMHQIIAATICHLGGYNTGLVVGWISPALPQLLSITKPVGDITLEQSSWLASIILIPTILCTPLSAIISERYGRKICLLISNIPYAITGLIVLIAKDVNTLIVGRLIGGFGCLLILSNTSAYIGEIAEPRIRGLLGSFFTVAYSIGITTAYAVGGFVSYIAIGWVILIMAIISFALFLFMPESPVYLIMKGKNEEAAKALAWLRQSDVKSEEIKSEMEFLHMTINSTSCSIITSLKMLFASKPLRRGFFICIAMFVGQSFTGMFVINSYSVAIFMESGQSSVTPEVATVIYGCIQTLGASGTSWLVERLGRKILLVFSQCAVSASMFTIGTYFYLKSIDYNLDDVSLLPVITLSFCIFVYMCGAGSVPYILLSELLLSEVRSVANMMVIFILNFLVFIFLRYFEPVSIAYGRHVVFFFFATCTLISIVITLVFLKETKGKNAQEIVDINYNFRKKIVFNTDEKTNKK